MPINFNRLFAFCSSVFIICFCLSTGFAQDITTEGRDFWLGFMENNVAQNQPVDLKIYISATDSTGGLVHIPGANWSQNFTVQANATTLVQVPTNIAMAQSSGVKESKGIHITSEANVTVYALNSRALSADATVVLPTPALGKTYYVMSYIGSPPSLFSEFLIVATEANTEVEITPTANTNDGHAAGITYKETLSVGQVLQVQSQADLTGTKINAAGSCKNFAVFSGNEWTNVGDCGPAQDHLYEQLFPVSTWGKQYATVPYRGRTGGDVFKIVAAEESTTVTISGQASFVLHAGQSTTRLLTLPSTITADKPIQVAQLSRSQNCDNQAGDPFMILLSPLEQTLQKITFNAFNVTVIQNYYTNIITPTASVNILTLDGVTISSQFFPFPNNPQYSYAQVGILPGNHTIQSSAGFSSCVYGYGNIESFGYATGAKLDNLNMVITPVRKKTTETTSTVCAGDTVLLSVSSEKTFSMFQWNAEGIIKTGNTAEYIFANGGNYFVSVTGITETDNCSDQETSVILIKVIEPNEKILGPASVCPFNEGVPYFVKADLQNTYQWFAEGGVITNNTAGDTILINWGDTNDQARVRLRTINSMGCVGDTTALQIKINVQLEPILPIGVDSLCSSAIETILYGVYPNPTSIYTWSVAGGQINSGQGTNEVSISWNGPGIAMLSYKEESTINAICSGDSDTLQIFIERDPEELLSVITAKSEFQIEEPILFQYSGDTLFNFKSWNFGNGITIDSVYKELPVSHSYTCPGIYTVEVTTYTGTVCQNVGKGMATISVLEPKLVLQSVTHHIEKDSTLEIYSQLSHIDFFKGNISLLRREADPDLSDWVTLVENERDGIHVDSLVSPSKTIYDYKLLMRLTCGTIIESLPHNNIRLSVTKDSTESTITLSRNAYINWDHGVARYELWKQINNNDSVYVYDMGTEVSGDDYNNDGFTYCFKIKAVENGGTNFSWSNTACLDFIPNVEIYNVITPNDDSKNDVFVIDGIGNYPDNKLTIFNRYGQSVYTTKGYTNTWRGVDNHEKELSTGVYFYLLELNDSRVKSNTMKGMISILR